MVDVSNNFDTIIYQCTNHKKPSIGNFLLQGGVITNMYHFNAVYALKSTYRDAQCTELLLLKKIMM